MKLKNLNLVLPFLWTASAWAQVPATVARGLPPAGPLRGDEMIPIDQGPGGGGPVLARQVSLDAIAAWLEANPFSSPALALGGRSPPKTPFSIAAAPYELVASTADPDPATTGALINYRPSIDAANHRVGFYVHPRTPTNARDPNSFVDAFDVYWGGDSTGSIPAGTKTVLGGMDVNIGTAQRASDVSEGDHAYGATLTSSGGAEIRGAAFALANSKVASVIRGVDIEADANVAGSTVLGYEAATAGSQNGTTAFTAIGRWSQGFAYNDFSVQWDGSHTYVAADGYQARAGLAGAFTGNKFDVSWNGLTPHLWIDVTDLGQINVSGRPQVSTQSERHAITAVTGSFVYDAAMHNVVVGSRARALSAAVVGSLPACTTAIAGVTYGLKKVDRSGYAATLWAARFNPQTRSADAIDGASSFPLKTQYAAVHVQCDGAGNWWTGLE